MDDCLGTRACGFEEAILGFGTTGEEKEGVSQEEREIGNRRTFEFRAWTERRRQNIPRRQPEPEILAKKPRANTCYILSTCAAGQPCLTMEGGPVSNREREL